MEEKALTELVHGTIDASALKVFIFFKTLFETVKNEKVKIGDTSVRNLTFDEFLEVAIQALELVIKGLNEKLK